MVFQAVPDTAECVLEFLANTVTMKNVIHALKPGGYSLADLTVLADTVDASIAAAWLGQMSQDVTYVQVTVRGLAFENDLEVTVNTSSAAGTVLAPALPGNVTMAVKKSSGLTGRSARGRLFWIGLTAGQLDANENQVGVVAAADIVSNIDSLRASIAGTVWSPVIVSRFLNKVKRPFGITFPWIANSTVDRNVDSMRPRLLG
ncbi:hypothetical protein LCGC14_2598340 [marine sediment metagenome]|uniref:Uncharacterized protein n=1 Tax=marine sediment metagenome TaxID=412755 RepID=A0A0F9D2A5_9ZZZZ